ncbi:amidohydrolase family protein [Xiamenia xianingshaonis]|uniref:Amidohydrolase family protein n=1 Tax=Xiamenia xianingshaonis TaxID=2682776 RepID=A0A9E6MQ07_9ACTN|nr:amidohydrolase family protein [Xiamenia xianingshaonis]NGM17924.1 amidohydrolase family protein [Eggerthellaceae bacterium zg-893]NHM14679.1 amidohydrolase family protein [Xiamenia xianingshaonis]NHM16364.1 amidohydrolase family protein [Xiamenia xianingshaonis]QTU84288.1 amidohydrolase family protein [Xiamenia xianingshaonis]
MLLSASYVLPITSEPIANGAVLVRDDKIRDIGTLDMLRLRYPDEEVRDFGKAAILPGLIDLHTHVENAVMRGIVHDVPYTTWITSTLKIAAKMDVADWFDSAILGGLEALSSGITCIADITTTGAACTAMQHLGMRSVIYREVGAMEKSRVDFAMRQAENDIRHWREEVDGSRISIGIAPAAIYACHPSVFTRVSELANREGLPVAMHMAGAQEEYNFVRYGSSPFAVHTMDNKRGFVEIPPWLPTGTTPVRYALEWGAFEAENVLAIHCVHVDDQDIQKLKEYDVAVGVCPRCNAQLGMGVAPIQDFLQAGLKLGLGTDSPAATDSIDMMEEMRLGMLIQRAVNSRAFLDAQKMLHMATIGGARALRIDDKVGSLEIGKQADIIAVDLSGSHQTPAIDPVSAIVNTCSGSDVAMTMIDGNVLYEKDRWNVGVEVARSIARVIEIRSKLRM